MFHLSLGQEVIAVAVDGLFFPFLLHLRKSPYTLRIRAHQRVWSIFFPDQGRNEPQGAAAAKKAGGRGLIRSAKIKSVVFCPFAKQTPNTARGLILAGYLFDKCTCRPILNVTAKLVQVGGADDCPEHGIGADEDDYNEDVEYCENNRCGARLEEGRIGYCDECLAAGYGKEDNMEQQLEGAREIPPRPKFWDEEIKRKPAERLAGDVNVWLGGRDYPNVEEALFDALKMSADLDGYALARYLDDEHDWNVDAELVEILGGAYSAIRSAHNEAQREWVQANGIKPTLPAGQVIRISAALLDSQQDESRIVTASVNHIDMNLGQYWLYCRDLGTRVGFGIACELLEAKAQIVKEEETPCQ